MNVTILQSDISASNINSILKCAENTTNIHVNTTPGTKGQNASMTFWGMKNSCKIWTLNGPKLECINNDNGKVDIGKVYPGDIITTLKILYGDIKNYIKAIEQNDQELKDNSQFLNVLLKQIRCCCNTSREWNKNNGYISVKKLFPNETQSGRIEWIWSLNRNQKEEEIWEDSQI